MTRHGRLDKVAPSCRFYEFPPVYGFQFAKKSSTERKALLATIAWQEDHDQERLLEAAKAASAANAAALLANQEVLSRLESMIGHRIGARVRHVRSEPVLKTTPGARRPMVSRRAYTRHWFDVLGRIPGTLRHLLDDNQQLRVFVKSALRLRIRPDLEFTLSEAGGRGFRAPYFFGHFTASDLHVAAWESVDFKQMSLVKHSFEARQRLVKAIAELNALPSAGTAPVETKWIEVQPGWLESRYAAMRAIVGEQWKDLYARTVDVMEHHDDLSAQLRSSGQTFLAHNDLTIDASNFVIPEHGDVIIFDWEEATLNVAGADLGLLCRLDPGDRLMTSYVESMAERGFRLDMTRLRFTADIIWGFRLLKSGWRAMEHRKVAVGLELLTRHMAAKRPTAVGTDVKAPSPRLTARLEQYLGRRSGRPYQPIPHPAFAHLGYQNGPERFNLIAPHLDHKNGTVLDIGSQWGYMAHRLEDLGYDVTAVESSKAHAYFLNEIRELCGKSFKVVHASVFELGELNYDVVFALNVFHHFMKKEHSFEQFVSLLDRLECRTLIYQAHSPAEQQMVDAYRNMSPQEATLLLSKKLSLPRVFHLGTLRRGREIFKLSK